MSRDEGEAAELLRELHRLKAWLITAAFLLMATLTCVVMMLRAEKANTGQILYNIERTAEVKAAYESQKTELYKFGNRLTDAQIDIETRLKLLEKDDD